MHHLLDIKIGTPEWIFFSIGFCLVSFFLLQFYLTVKETAKDVRSILIKHAQGEEKSKQHAEEIGELKETVHEHGNKIQQHELQLSILKNKSS